MATKTYFNVLLLGRTGQGKSTVGNKLLQSRVSSKATDGEPDVHKKIDLDYSSSAAAAQDTDGRFEESTGYESCTKRCELLSANGVTVLDTPGFADSEKFAVAGGIYGANLSMFRSITRKQKESHVRFDRVLYFLPERGRIEKVHGYLLEEIEVMHYFYGNAIFECMIVVATRDEFSQQGVDHILLEERCKEAFAKALQLTRLTGTRPHCPQVMFIPFDIRGEKLLQMIQNANIPNDACLNECAFVDSVCAKCAVNIIYQEGKEHTPDNRISVCANNGEVDYNESKCHPCMIPKYSTIVKIGQAVGCLLHLEFRRSIKFLGNNEEICISCNKPPNSDGCTNVRTTYDIPTGNDTFALYVDHMSDVENNNCVHE